MNWIKRTGAENAKKGGKDVVIADSKDKDCVRKIEIGVQNGAQVLLQDVGEELDPVLDNVLNKSLIKGYGGAMCVRIGDKEIEYHKDFKLYITTRISNPHYTPEVSTKVAVVNFSVK